ncbi:hypothetical protein N0V93_002901 [Gnomoniopsis smithogilvyi]|uniref:SP-RING-type domain-containing protein n=1 Tax=Gnomoniopsis smithogilvyi TaxID=1191159 RepID=A0A9W9CYM5_9PEZI|nr:hypothetical protein N0V93_002901 [Gnomoniopsis smithogilvyi]
MFAHSRRTLQSAGSSRQGSRRPQASRPAADDASLELPDYQEPCHPLTANGQRELREFSSTRLNTKLQKHTDESAKLLASTVFAINERVTNRKEVVERVIKKRRGNHDGQEVENDADVDSVRERVAELEELVNPLTLKVEKAMREVLDMRAALQDEKDVLNNLPDAIKTAQEEKASQAMQNEHHDELDEPPVVPGVSIHRIIEQGREETAKAYNDLSTFQRYAKNNTYIDFKRNWHEGLYPNDEIPVPDPKTWFDRDGRPQHLTEADGHNTNDSDDDIQISKEKRSFRCPLSLVALTEPYTSRRCKHSFQKEAIYSYLGIKGPNSRGLQKGCPESGCDIKDMKKDDLFFDEPLLRKIKRAEQLEREAAEGSSDREEEEDEQDDPTVDAPVKPEPTAGEDKIEEDDDRAFDM